MRWDKPWEKSWDMGQDDNIRKLFENKYGESYLYALKTGYEKLLKRIQKEIDQGPVILVTDIEKRVSNSIESVSGVDEQYFNDPDYRGYLQRRLFDEQKINMSIEETTDTKYEFRPKKVVFTFTRAVR